MTAGSQMVHGSRMTPGLRSTSVVQGRQMDHPLQHQALTGDAPRARRGPGSAAVRPGSRCRPGARLMRQIARHQPQRAGQDVAEHQIVRTAIPHPDAAASHRRGSAAPAYARRLSRALSRATRTDQGSISVASDRPAQGLRRGHRQDAGPGAQIEDPARTAVAQRHAPARSGSRGSNCARRSRTPRRRRGSARCGRGAAARSDGCRGSAKRAADATVRGTPRGCAPASRRRASARVSADGGHAGHGGGERQRAGQFVVLGADGADALEPPGAGGVIAEERQPFRTRRPSAAS